MHCTEPAPLRDDPESGMSEKSPTPFQRLSFLPDTVELYSIGNNLIMVSDS